VNALSAILAGLDARLKRIAVERYASLLLVPSAIVILALGSAISLWGVDGVFRVHLYPQATVVWAVSLPLVFFSYEGLVAVWRCRFSFGRKLAFSLCHIVAIALSVTPILVFLALVVAIGGVHGDR
jgi:hypothetical protein